MSAQGECGFRTRSVRPERAMSCAHLLPMLSTDAQPTLCDRAGELQRRVINMMTAAPLIVALSVTSVGATKTD